MWQKSGGHEHLLILCTAEMTHLKPQAFNSIQQLRIKRTIVPKSRRHLMSPSPRPKNGKSDCTTFCSNGLQIFARANPNSVHVDSLTTLGGWSSVIALTVCLRSGQCPHLAARVSILQNGVEIGGAPR